MPLGSKKQVCFQDGLSAPMAKARWRLLEKLSRIRRNLLLTLADILGLPENMPGMFIREFMDALMMVSIEKIFAAFHSQMLSRGIYLAPSGFEVGFLSAAHTTEDIESTVEVVKGSLKAIL